MPEIAAAIHLLQPVHFVSPFLMRLNRWIRGSRHDCSRLCAYVVGAVFLLGGIANLFMLPSPKFGHIPMAGSALM